MKFIYTGHTSDGLFIDLFSYTKMVFCVWLRTFYLLLDFLCRHVGNNNRMNNQLFKIKRFSPYLFIGLYYFFFYKNNKRIPSNKGQIFFFDII